MRAAAILLSLIVADAAGAECPTDNWTRMLAPGPQIPVLKDRFVTASGRDVLLFEFVGLEDDPLAGDFAKRWVYMVLTDGPRPCIAEAVSLGSYTASVGPVSGDAPRSFHLDHYDGDTHATLDWFEGEPSLDELTPRALAALD